jgi:chemotaxis protein MotB
MADHHPEIIIIKRRSSHEEEHHGGAWKIAFADFMTAMMAFFLVLWIINATDKNTKTMIARYFNPVKMEQSSRTPKNIRSDGPAPAVDGPEYKDPHPTDPSAPETKNPSPDAVPPQGRIGDKPGQGGANGALEPSDPANPKPTMTEGVLFNDPYRSLDAIAGPASPDQHTVAKADKPKDPSETNAEAEAFRDPFRPIGREAPNEAAIPAEKPAPKTGAAPTAPSTPAALDGKPAAGPVAPQVAAADADGQKALAATAARLQKELELQIAPPGAPHAGPAIEVKATGEGLLISLTDNLKYSMFPLGSAEPQRQVVQAMEAVARTLKDRPGLIVVRGHTDGRPYKSATYDNWRLSSARAQMAYYMLTRGGIPENRVERIEGYADKRLRDPAHPLAAENRRIEILVREAKP